MKKFLIIISVVFFVLLAAIEIYVQSDAFSEWIRPRIAGALEDILGPDARIGLVRAHFIPPSLEVRDIMLPDAQGGEAVYVRKARVYINPVPLLIKKIRLPSISVLEPRIHAVRAADGTFSIMPLVERVKANLARRNQGARSRYSILLRTITIRNGGIWLKDAGLSSEASVTGMNLTARVNVAMDRVSASIRASQVRIATRDYPAITGTLRIIASYDRGRFHLASAELAAGDALVTLSGDVGPLPDAIMDLKGRVRSGPTTLGRLTDILKSAPKQAESRLEASVVIKGTSSDPHIAGNIEHSGIFYRGVTLSDAALSFQYRNQDLTLSGENWRIGKGGKILTVDRITAAIGYRRGVFDIQAAEIVAGDLAVRMQGEIDASRGFNAQLAAESSGAGRTVSYIATQPIEGKVALDGRLVGALSAPVFEGMITAGPVAVRKIQFNNVRGNVQFRDRVVMLSSVDIDRQSSHYSLDGSIDFKGPEPVYSARLKVGRSDVVSIASMFYEPLPLELSASGELSFHGTAHEYSGSGHLSLDAGRAYGESFARGAITASLSTGKISFPQVVVYKQKGMVKATGWIGFDGTYSADLETRDIDLAAVNRLGGIPVGGDFSLDIHSSGTFSAPVANISLDVEKLTLLQESVGRMHAVAKLQDSSMQITAGLSEDRARLSVLWALRRPYAWSAEASIQTNGINPLQLIGNKDVSDRVTVVTAGTMSIRGEGLNFSSVSGKAAFQRIGIAIGEFRIDSEDGAVINIEGGRLDAQSLRFSGPGTKIIITGSTKIFNDIGIVVNGTANLSLLKLFFKEVEYAAGTAEMKLAVRDKWSDPEVTGDLHIRGGEIKIKDIPQKFTNMSGTISFAQGRVVTESLAGEMGGGLLSVSGWAQLSGAALQDFSVRTSVNNVSIRYPADLASTLSGDLYYDGDADEQTLSGEIAIKRARYDKRIEWKSMLVDIRRDLYQKKKTDIGWIGDTQLNIRFHGADNILFQNNLAKMPLEVDMFLRGTVNRPQFLGRIEARKGSIYLRKNDFNILHAAVDFVDPNRLNPVLDIQAETQVREYRIRLAVTGTAERALITFISDPPLIDTDILSLLALGKKSSELIGKETNVGVGEAASFASGQFQDIFERRARSLTGLDRFQVDPYIGKSDTSVPRVTVGKELIQNKLFVTYSSNVGATIPEQIFRIEYILNKNFSLVGERNEELGNTGGDIKYRFEFQ